MKAIDELRVFLSKSPSVVYPDEVLGYLDAIDRELEEEYVELPKDANDIPVHIGDVLQGERCGGGWCEPFKVTSMKVDENEWKVYEFGYRGHLPNLCSHKPLTVEEVLREFAKSIAEVLGGDEFLLRDDDEMYTEFAERLQLREEEQ